MKLGGVERNTQATGNRFVGSTIRHRRKHFELTARQSGAAGTIGLEQIIGKRSLIEQPRKELRRHDDKPGANRLDGCDNLMTAGRAIEDGARAPAKRANDVLAVRPVEQSYQSYPTVSGAIVGQQLLCWDVRQEDIDAIPIDQFRKGRRLVENPNDDDRRLVAWQLFEVAAQDRISGENRDGDHEDWPAQSRRNYATGRSPMTTRTAVSAPPRINARSTVLPTLSGPSSRMISRTRSIGFPFQAVTISPTRIPARADGPLGSMLTTRTPRRLSEDCDPLDARSCFMGWSPAPR